MQCIQMFAENGVFGQITIKLCEPKLSTPKATWVY